MQLKLSKAQLQALERELSHVFDNEHFDMTDKLLAAVLNKLYKKIVVKLLNIQAQYTMTLDDETALALYLYYEDSVFNPTDFDDITLKTICNNIERKYA